MSDRAHRNELTSGNRSSNRKLKLLAASAVTPITHLMVPRQRNAFDNDTATLDHLHSFRGTPFHALCSSAVDFTQPFANGAHGLSLPR
jgi:hypothetical protein